MAKNMLQRFIALLIALFLLSFLSSCQATKKREYYSEKENYVNASGVLDSIYYNDDHTALYINFSETNPQFDDTCFKIVGINLKTVTEKGLVDKVKAGDQVQFVTAPKYFGDGYVMPIVALSINGENLLEFDEGFANLQIWLDGE